MSLRAIRNILDVSPPAHSYARDVYPEITHEVGAAAITTIHVPRVSPNGESSEAQRSPVSVSPVALAGLLNLPEMTRIIGGHLDPRSRIALAGTNRLVRSQLLETELPVAMMITHDTPRVSTSEEANAILKRIQREFPSAFQGELLEALGAQIYALGEVHRDAALDTFLPVARSYSGPRPALLDAIVQAADNPGGTRASESPVARIIIGDISRVRTSPKANVMLERIQREIPLEEAQGKPLEALGAQIYNLGDTDRSAALDTFLPVARSYSGPRPALLDAIVQAADNPGGTRSGYLSRLSAEFAVQGGAAAAQAARDNNITHPLDLVELQAKQIRIANSGGPRDSVLDLVELQAQQIRIR